MEILTGIVDKIVELLPLALQVIGAFAAIATITPNKVDDKIAQFLLDVVNFLGANLGKAKNDENV